MKTIGDCPQVAPAIDTTLHALRRRIRQYVWAQGLADNLAWLGAAFWLTLAIDWFFEPPVAIRVLMLSTVFGVLVVIFVRQIVRRAFARLTNSNMATVLERRFPHLNDSLLTAVYLCARPENVGCNRQMLSSVCHTAAQEIKTLSLDEVFNPRPLRNSFTAAILLIFSVMVFGIVCPKAMGVWARRNLALSEQLWPRTTRLEIVGFPDGSRKVARGSDVDIVVRADTSMPRVPQTVEIRYREAGGSRGRATMNRVGTADPAKEPYQEFVYTRRNVLSPIRFDIYGGDDSICAQRIDVVDSPTINLTLECAFPAYMNRPSRTMPVTGAMPLAQGSSVTVHAYANKDLRCVEINTIADEKNPPPPQIINIPESSPDRREFKYALPPLEKDTTLLFTLFDSDGIKSADPVRLALSAIPDQAPQVAVQLDGIGTAVTPLARAPFVGRVTDDYGIAKIWFEHAVDQAKAQASAIDTLAQGAVEFLLDPRSAALELRELKLKPGQKLLLGVKAADLCTLGKGPNVGASESWLLDVVTPDQLLTLLKSRELVLRQQFEVAVKETTETRDLLAHMQFSHAGPGSDSIPGGGDQAKKTDRTASSAKSASTGKPDQPGREPEDQSADGLSDQSPQRRIALHMLRVQSALTNCRKTTQEILGLAEAFTDICKQLDNNRINTEELRQRLQSGIADPLQNIAREMLPELERRLDNLQSRLEDEGLCPPARDAALSQAQAVLLAMHRILDRMIELQDYNEMVEMLRDIIKMQEQLRQQTDQRQKQIIREFLKE